jgi:hypothetical protein
MILGKIGHFFQSVLFIHFPAATQPPSAKKIKLVELDGAAADDGGGATTPSNGSGGDDVTVDVSFEQVDANGDDEPGVARAQVPAADMTAPTDETNGAGGETAANDSDTEADEGKLVEAIDEHGLAFANQNVRPYIAFHCTVP